MSKGENPISTIRKCGRASQSTENRRAGPRSTGTSVTAEIRARLPICICSATLLFNLAGRLWVLNSGDRAIPALVPSCEVSGQRCEKHKACLKAGHMCNPGQLRGVPGIPPEFPASHCLARTGRDSMRRRWAGRGRSQMTEGV